MLFSGVHLVVFLSLLLLSLASLDIDAEEAGFPARALTHLVWALGQPGFQVHAVTSKAVESDALEWAIVFANSLVWGATACLSLRLLRRS